MSLCASKQIYFYIDLTNFDGVSFTSRFVWVSMLNEMYALPVGCADVPSEGCRSSPLKTRSL